MNKPGETFSEQLERLEMMADPDQGCTWDLSDNDRAAIRAILDNYRRVLGGEFD